MRTATPFGSNSIRRVRGAFAALIIAVSIIFGGFSTAVFADDYSGCVDGYERYNNNIRQYQHYINLCRSDGTGDAAADAACGETVTICDRIAPGVGYTYCNKFIRSGYGTQAQRRWARQVATRLIQFYRGCQAQ